MVFANSWGPSPVLSLGFPDVCTTPVGPVPVPVPYPNIALSYTSIPTQFQVLITCMPAANLLTTDVISLGDQPGVLLGVASGMCMGPKRPLLGSFNVVFGGMPSTKMLGLTGHNGASPNIPGLAITPSQVKVMVLR